ncbi:MAG: threonine--tRNA ligase, partial [Vicinamibacterales bacterium]|nr:threonine--tRNA ligase [Vicinamibacterales bacterium]
MMDQVTVTLPDGSTRQMPVGAPVREVAEGISPRLAKAALAAAVGDQIVDLTHPLEDDATVRIITKDGAEALELYRHSTAHLLAAAVTALFPEAQCGIGPPTDEGFFYDFVVDHPFVPEDLEAIEKKMREIASKDLVYERKLMPKEEAKRYFADRGEPLKVQLIDEKGGPVVSCYTIDDVFMDFCTGPHVPSSGKLKAFKVLTSSNAYWKGDAKNQPMQRIYGTAFFSNKELQEHLTRLEEAKKRDHRKLGRELGLFTFHQWAPGAAFWLAHGTTLWNQLADYMRSMLFPAGYVELRTPLVYNKKLWETSGHWEHYAENMLQVESEGETYSLKPMNCPGHMLVFAGEVRSYRDLPIRYHDQSVLHRDEASGVLAGLTRARQFCQDDAHCFVTPEQISDEVELLLRLVQRVYSDFQLEFTVELSTRPETFLGVPETWDQAESQLEQALDAAGQKYEIAAGEGNFYGPKIDFHVVDAIGRNWQCATIQLDYQLPERFELKYIGADNAEHRPVVIHRAIFGSFERFIALLIEHYAG